MSINSKLFEQPAKPEPDSYQQAMQAQESVASIVPDAPEKHDFDGDRKDLERILSNVLRKHRPTYRQHLEDNAKVDPATLKRAIVNRSFKETGAAPPNSEVGRDPRTDLEIELAKPPERTGRTLSEIVNAKRGPVPEVYDRTTRGLEAIVLEPDRKLRCVSRTVSVKDMISRHQIPLPTGDLKDNLKNMSEVSRTLDEHLALDDLSFKVYRKTDFDTMGKPIKLHNAMVERQGTKPHIYLLMHGWTGTHEIFEMDMVQRILENDPEAVIVAPDGNGFGNSRFKQGLSTREQIEKCSVQQYADQMEFLMKNVLGLDQEQMADLRVFGHSMGGATAMVLAARGVGSSKTGRVVAAAPALLTPRTETEKQDPKAKVEQYIDPESEYSSETDPHERDIGLTYKGLNLAMNVAEVASKIPFMDKTTKVIVGQLFERILGKPLMGQTKNGNIPQEIFQEYMRQLNIIHKNQLQEKKGLAAYAMDVLHKGVSPSEFTPEQLRLMATNVITIEGKDDNLGTGIHFNQWINELNKYGTIRRHIIKNAGHYEPVFDTQSLKELMPERAAFLN